MAERVPPAPGRRQRPPVHHPTSPGDWRRSPCLRRWLPRRRYCGCRVLQKKPTRRCGSRSPAQNHARCFHCGHAVPARTPLTDRVPGRHAAGHPGRADSAARCSVRILPGIMPITGVLGPEACVRNVSAVTVFRCTVLPPGGAGISRPTKVSAFTARPRRNTVWMAQLSRSSSSKKSAR